MSVLALRDLELVDKSVHQEALELFASTNLPYADSYNVAYMRWRKIDRIYGWDTDFDHIQGIERIEPAT